LFENGTVFSGTWCFASAANSDRCDIIGSNGSISFSFFNGNTIELAANGTTTHFDFPALQHVQQPMIEQTVNYFLDQALNPCTAAEGAEIMRWIEAFASR